MEVSEVEGIILKEKLGAGSFGLVRKGVMKSTGEEVAVKLEERTVRRALLEREADVLRLLQACEYVPKIYSNGISDNYSFMSMQLLGSSLSQKLRASGGHLSPATVLQCSVQMLAALRFMHSLSYVHRDVKPQNFLLGLKSSKRKVFLIDFGLARKCQDTGIFRSSEGQLTGTLPYMSINIHLGLPACPRDDLESLAYVFIYLLRGSLPWHHPEEQLLSEKATRSSKQRADIMQLCKGLPVEFEMLLRYVKGLRSDDSINYAALEREFTRASCGVSVDQGVDFKDIKERKRRSRRKSQGQARISIDVPTQCLSDIPPQYSLSPSPIHSSPTRHLLTREKTQEKLFLGFSPSARASILRKSRESKSNQNCL